jgi:hypothetical protein
VVLPDGVETWREVVSGALGSDVVVVEEEGMVVCEERAASAARWRRSNSACWSAGRRGGEGPVWRKEDARRAGAGVEVRGVMARERVRGRAWRSGRRRDIFGRFLSSLRSFSCAVV